MNLTSRYLGLTLKNPLVAAASTVGMKIDNIRQLEDNGAAAVVLPSIFEEEIDFDIEEAERLLFATGSEASSYLPYGGEDGMGAEKYLDLIRQAREAVDIPVIASLNGISRAGWTQYASEVEQAGANAIELNIYFLPTDCAPTGREVEERYLDILRAVKACTSIPVSMKLSPYFSSPGHFIKELDDAGADGFVLFNRFYQPDIDLRETAMTRDLRLSNRAEIRLPLLWIGSLAGRIKGSIAASTGVATADEVLKYLLVGADVVMTASALIRHGIGHMRSLLEGLQAGMTVRELDHLDQLRGQLSRRSVTDPTAFDRANYVKILKAVTPIDS
ncbi:MAG TPA: dihydroorotate dehydrogenase-like protein [Rhodospirillaceae bacterium]|nr:dihydroorotate dehydrogenase-like protein [Rhodospirillaceae bacterium]